MPVCLLAQVSSGEPITCLSPSAQVCSGWSQVTWVLPRELQIEGVVVEDQGSSSLLQIFNASWQTSGRYTCKETSSDLSKAIDVFVPGEGEGDVASPLTTTWVQTHLLIADPVPSQVHSSGSFHRVPDR